MKKHAVLLYVILAVIALLVEFYAYQPLTVKVGELAAASWQQLPEFNRDLINATGIGNYYRPVLFAENTPCLELASGNDGAVEYRVDVPVLPDQDLHWRLMFLSTQGNGRVEIRAFDSGGKLLLTSGYAFSGAAAFDAQRKMHSERSKFNYTGDWVDEQKNIDDMLQADFAGNASQITRLELVLIVEKGQHVLVEKFGSEQNYSRTLAVKSEPVTAVKGESFTAKIEVKNNGSRAINSGAVNLSVPYGFGVIPAGGNKTLVLAPGESKILLLELQAKRASSVNLNKPWQVDFLVNGQNCGKISVNVMDDQPGKIFYVMTEDLEVIDAAGYEKPWGSRLAWITAEEIRVQMKNKAESLNAIAEKYGALWTHYIAWPIIRAAREMAAAGGDDWSAVVADVTESVSNQSRRGHEYGLHMHSDYDPLLPGNSLSINYQQNAFWANHLRHGWAHSVKAAGEFDEYDTRAGILYSYVAELQNVTKDSPNGTSISARAGSFDYGVGTEDQANSYIAYEKTGILGSSDAPGNVGEFVSADYGNEIYFARPDAIENPALDAEDIGLVEFVPTPKKRIEYDLDSLEELNQKVDAGVNAFTASGLVKPGVHAIIGFTHAMFIMGEGTWQATAGGMFDKVDRHLEYVKNQYAGKKLMEFATASQLVKEYLDYYSPQPLAVVDRLVIDAGGCAEYKVTVLGKDIVTGGIYQHPVIVKYPLWLRDTAYAAAICKNGKIIAYYNQLPTTDNDLKFVYNDRSAVYTLRVWHDKRIKALLDFARDFSQSLGKFLTKF